MEIHDNSNYEGNNLFLLNNKITLNIKININIPYQDYLIAQVLRLY